MSSGAAEDLVCAAAGSFGLQGSAHERCNLMQVKFDFAARCGPGSWPETTLAIESADRDSDELDF